MKPLIKQLLPKALKTSAVVGTVLVSINQFEAVFANEQIIFWKMGLTYLVPFTVYLYSAISNTWALQKQARQYGIEKV